MERERERGRESASVCFQLWELHYSPPAHRRLATKELIKPEAPVWEDLVAVWLLVSENLSNLFSDEESPAAKLPTLAISGRIWLLKKNLSLSSLSLFF